MDPTILSIVLVFSIPIVAILSGAANKWFKLRAEQRALGVSNRELEQKVQRLETESAESSRRLENLEAVVASQAWSALHDPGLSAAERQSRFVATGPHEVPAAEDVNRQRTADLARRLGG
jgi:hypothetical protein